MRLLRPGDVVVLLAAGMLVGASWAALWSGGGPAEYVEISVPGATPTRLALAADTVVEIEGRLGPSVIEVRDGRARFIDSPCVGRQCVHAGWLSRGGQVAACLPNGVVVEVGGGRREFDAVTF